MKRWVEEMDNAADGPDGSVSRAEDTDTDPQGLASSLGCHGSLKLAASCRKMSAS